MTAEEVIRNERNFYLNNGIHSCAEFCSNVLKYGTGKSSIEIIDKLKEHRGQVIFFDDTINALIQKLQLI